MQGSHCQKMSSSFLLSKVQQLTFPGTTFIINAYDIGQPAEKKGRLIMPKKGQTHTHADNNGLEHTHSHEAGTVHKHTHENTKAVLNRLSRASGHLESVKRMIEEGRDCSEVLIQLSAVIAALNNAGKVILQDHIEHCIVDAIESSDDTAIENLNKAIDRFIK